MPRPAKKPDECKECGVWAPDRCLTCKGCTHCCTCADGRGGCDSCSSNDMEDCTVEGAKEIVAGKRAPKGKKEPRRYVTGTDGKAYEELKGRNGFRTDKPKELPAHK